MHSHRLTDWESHLVIRAQAGEAVAFELLADTHRDSMRSLALRMLRHSDDAKDAVQDSFLKAFRAIHSFQPGRPVLPWLLRITSNCCVDVMRHRRVQTEPIDKYEFALPEGGPLISEGIESKIQGEWVHDAVDRLPEHYRNIIRMRHFGQMEVGEIANALNKPEGTIKSWLFRARALLKKDLRLLEA